jgi:hypothetical protein
VWVNAPDATSASITPGFFVPTAISAWLPQLDMPVHMTLSGQLNTQATSNLQGAAPKQQQQQVKS